VSGDSSIPVDVSDIAKDDAESRNATAIRVNLVIGSPPTSTMIWFGAKSNDPSVLEGLLSLDWNLTCAFFWGEAVLAILQGVLAKSGGRTWFFDG